MRLSRHILAAFVVGSVMLSGTASAMALGTQTSHLPSSTADQMAKSYANDALSTAGQCAVTAGAQALASQLSKVVPYGRVSYAAGKFVNLVVGATNPCDAAKQMAATALALHRAAASRDTLYQNLPDYHVYRGLLPDLCSWRVWVNGRQTQDIRWVAALGGC